MYFSGMNAVAHTLLNSYKVRCPLSCTLEWRCMREELCSDNFDNRSKQTHNKPKILSVLTITKYSKYRHIP